MPYAGVNGQRLYYEVGGEGDLLVLLHGFLGNGDLMEAPATGLASGFRALRYDRRGNGRSNPVTEAVSLSDDVADLTALIDWFGAPATHFLAHDTGAELALEFALTQPGKTLSIGLLAPTLSGLPPDPETAAATATLLSALKTNAAKALEEKFFPLPIFDGTREREGMFDRVSDLFRRFLPSPGRFEPPAGPPAPHAQRLGEISSPCLVAIGGRDTPERARAAQAIVAGVAGAEAMVFPDLSRFLHIEESRAVMRRLTDFFLPEPVIER